MRPHEEAYHDQRRHVHGRSHGGGDAERRKWDGPLSGTALNASQALRTAHYTTVQDMVWACSELGTVEQARVAMAGRIAKQALLRRWADFAAGWVREEALKQLEELAANRLSLPEHDQTAA